jgi:hypothetical protein
VPSCGTSSRPPEQALTGCLHPPAAAGLRFIDNSSAVLSTDPQVRLAPAQPARRQRAAPAGRAQKPRAVRLAPEAGGDVVIVLNLDLPPGPASSGRQRDGTHMSLALVLAAAPQGLAAHGGNKTWPEGGTAAQAPRGARAGRLPAAAALSAGRPVNCRAVFRVHRGAGRAAARCPATGERTDAGAVRRREEKTRMATDVQQAQTAPPAAGPGRPAGGTETAVVRASPAQASFFARLRQRAADCQAGTVPVSRDNLARVIADGHLADLDMRLVTRDADGPGKIAEAAARIARTWRDNPPAVAGPQVVFCDTGLPPGFGAGGWDAHSELAALLAEKGIPPDAVRSGLAGIIRDGGAGDLLAAYRDGSVAVLIGSTPELLALPAGPAPAAVHHLDAPWSADASASRAGRQAAPGNPACPVVRYVAEGGIDAAMWDALDAGADPAVAALRAVTGRLAVPPPTPRHARAQPARQGMTAVRPRPAAR